jgi:hypothetical protein
MNFATNITMLVGLTVLHGTEVMAEKEPASPGVSTTTVSDAPEYINEAREAREREGERTVADIVNEARARMDWGPPRKIEGEREPRTFYVALGAELGQKLYNFEELRRLEATHRANSPLEYVVPARDFAVESSSGITLAIGYQLTRWLEIELTAHDLDSRFWQTGTFGEVTYANAPRTARPIDGLQSSQYSMTLYSLALLPRWDISDHLGIIARVGVSHAHSRLASDLYTKGQTGSTQTCQPTSNGGETCTTTYQYETRRWASSAQSRTEFIPVVGVGLQVLEFLRLEYHLHLGVPIGDGKTDLQSFHINVLMRPEWL